MRIPPDNEKSNLIRIEGDPQGVKEAKKELLELASRMVRQNIPLPCRASGFLLVILMSQLVHFSKLFTFGSGLRHSMKFFWALRRGCLATGNSVP